MTFPCEVNTKDIHRNLNLDNQFRFLCCRPLVIYSSKAIQDKMNIFGFKVMIIFLSNMLMKSVITELFFCETNVINTLRQSF